MIDLTKTKYIKVSPSMDHEMLLNAINDGTEIFGFVGGVLIENPDILVPSTFPDNEKIKLIRESYIYETEDENGEIISETRYRLVPELDSEGNPIMVPKTFREYVGNCVSPTNDGEYVIPLGKRNKYGNRHSVIEDEELRIWVDFFGIEKTLTKSEYHKTIIDGWPEESD